ncbi:MAG TPA: tetratricopeptide repeat protein [Sphingomicrobium sp.]|nr:tetratricopeptide repeat protein [Sphingomicrobium sp.]
MKSTITAIAALLSTAAFAAPAAAQFYGDVRTPQEAAKQQKPEVAPAQPGQPQVSKAAFKALQKLQAAVDSKNAAEIPADVAAANAVAKTADDRYMIGVLRYKAAEASKNESEKAAALEAMIASGFNGIAPSTLYADLGNTYSELKQIDRAIAAYQHGVQLDPANAAATGGLAEAFVAQGRASDAVAVLEKAIAAQASAGQKVSENWYKRAIAIAYKAKLPGAVPMSRALVEAYPTSANWHEALRLYEAVSKPDDARALDMLRLERATGALTEQYDVLHYADIAVRNGLVAEAKAVLEEGAAANRVNRDSTDFKEIYGLATETKPATDLPAAPEAGASGSKTLSVGDSYFGKGDYAKAAEFYRAAAGKSGIEPDLAKLRTGIALAMQGDNAGAAAALAEVKGSYQQLASYWAIYAATKR